jgi:hypothetical protein
MDGSESLDSPFSPIHFSELLSSNGVRKEEDTQSSWTPGARDLGVMTFLSGHPDDSNQQSCLGSWSDNLSIADKHAAQEFLRLPKETLVETMFQIKARYERKVRGIVNDLKDEVQFTKGTNTVLVNQLLESNEREKTFSDMLTSTLSQLLSTEQANVVAQATCQSLSAQLLSVKTQLEALQGEADKLETSWNEEKDMVQVRFGVPISVQIVDWRGMYPATLDTLSFTELDRIMQIKQMWRKSFSPNLTPIPAMPGMADIRKIEYIKNSGLERSFDIAKEDLGRLGRPMTETVVFHGTAVDNINR